MNSTYHTTYQYHFCLGENLLRGDGAQSCLSVCHQSSLSSPLSSPLLYWLRHQCWQIIQSGDDAAFRQSVIFPNNCANKPSLSALSCSLQPDPSNQVTWVTSPTIYRHVSGVLFFGYQLSTQKVIAVLEGKPRDFHVNLMLAMRETCDVCYAVDIIVKFPCCCIDRLILKNRTLINYLITLLNYKYL